MFQKMKLKIWKMIQKLTDKYVKEIDASCRSKVKRSYDSIRKKKQYKEGLIR